MKFVNPKNDVAFRKIFSNQNRTDILIGFLNAVLNLEGAKAIQSVQILNPYQTPKLETLKTTILDVRATDQRGISYIIEMQIAYVAGVKKRFTYYVAKAYAGQIERGEDYPKLNEVIFIGILDFVLFKKNPHYLSRHQVLDIETHEREFKDLEMNFIELPKFTKQEHEVSTLLEKWIYFIKHTEDLQVVPSHVTDPSLQMAYSEADRFGWSKDDLEAYEYRGMRVQDERGALDHAREVGRTEGLSEGRKEGEQAKALDTARKMRQEGLDIALIAKITGLTLPELEQL